MESQVEAPRRTERVRFETDRHLIVGDVTLPANGYQSRFSDAINRIDVSFLPLTNVELIPLDGGAPTRHAFLVLSKTHIRLAHPAD
jgi:hypothetical protein